MLKIKAFILITIFVMSSSICYGSNADSLKCPCDEFWSKLKRNYTWRIIPGAPKQNVPNIPGTEEAVVDKVINRSFYDTEKQTNEWQLLKVGKDHRGLYCSSGYSINTVTPEQIDKNGVYLPQGGIPALENLYKFFLLSPELYDTCSKSLETFRTH